MKMRRLCLMLTALVAVLMSVMGIATQAHALPVAAPVVYEGEPAVGWSEAAIVVDGEGRLLWSKNADERLALASVTKVMTAICALDSGVDLDVEHTLVATPDIWYSQLAHLKDGDTATLRDLLQVLLVYSANDAAINIGIIIDGSESAFVERMNNKVKELGLQNTHYMNTHGLEEDGHYSSAADLVLLGRYAFENYPLIADVVHKSSVDITISGEVRTFPSTDALLGTYPGVCGIKTGSVGAGDSFLGAYDDGSIRLFTCTLCAPTSESRWNDTRALLDWAKKCYWNIPVGREEAVVSVHPFAEQFLFDVVVCADKNTMLAVLPGDGAVDYELTLPSHGLILTKDVIVGEAVWEQSGKTLTTQYYSTQSTLTKVPAFPLFTLPVMEAFARMEAAA